MIREIIIFTLIALTLWNLHGMDVQYYAMSSPAMFEINLFIAVMCMFALGAVTAIDLKVVHDVKMEAFHGKQAAHVAA